MSWERALIYLLSAVSGVVACGESFRAAEPDAPDVGQSEAGQASSGASSSGGAADAGESAGGAAEGGGAGGAPPGGGGEAGATWEGPTPCKETAACAKGDNCVDELCVAPLSTCAAHKNKYPASKDGVYWLAGGGNAYRAYCDMTEAVALCSDKVGERVGRTRDSSRLEYKMTAVLLEDGRCKLWNLRGAADNYPLWRLEPLAGVPTAQTCVKLGFAADGVLGNCAYGASRTNCGYQVTPLHRYGNACSGCELNDGNFDHWVVQGPIKLSGVLSDASGKVFTTCKTSR